MSCLYTILLIFGLIFVGGDEAVLKEFSAVGTKVNSLYNISGLRSDPCTAHDCEILTSDGSRWTIFGTLVTRQRYLRTEAGERLPFGLARVASKDKALHEVGINVGITLKQSVQDVYDGPVKLQDGTDAILYIKFSKKGTVEEIGLTLGESE